MPAHEHYEFVLGRLVPVAPASTDHGELGANLTRLVMNHVYDNKLGRAYIAETGFDITPPATWARRCWEPISPSSGPIECRDGAASRHSRSRP